MRMPLSTVHHYVCDICKIEYFEPPKDYGKISIETHITRPNGNSDSWVNNLEICFECLEKVFVKIKEVE